MAIFVVIKCQQEVFEEEIERLQKKKCVKFTFQLLLFNPFRDETGLQRVGGRID